MSVSRSPSLLAASAERRKWRRASPLETHPVALAAATALPASIFRCLTCAEVGSVRTGNLKRLGGGPEKGGAWEEG